MKKGKILIVEDEAVTILDLQSRLEDLGYEVMGFARCGGGALQRIEEERPDLVLMDIRLRGGMDGIDAAGAIRRLYNVPVIFASAYSNDEVLRRAKVTEPYGYLLKPFDERELDTSIEMALYRHRAEQALKESELRLRLYARRLEALRQIDQAILVADSLEAIMEAALSLVGELIPNEQSCVVTLDCQAKEMTTLSIREGGEIRTARGRWSLRPGSAYCQALSRGEIQIVDYERLAGQMEKRGVWWAEPLPFYASVPLLRPGKLLGALILGLEEAEGLGQAQLEIVGEVADSLAVAIHQAHLREGMAQRSAELEARNAELDAFSHTVAHDLQDPLGLIIGFADILRREWGDLSDEDLLEYLGIISRTGRKMQNIIYELMLLSEVRSQEVEVYALDMAGVVAQAQERLMDLVASSGAGIHLPDRWPMAMGYGPWVEEVWVNYMNNAIKHGGQPPRVELGATEEGAQVRFWVRDNGPGVPPGAQEALFVPFTRLGQVRANGHGLGLSIVRRIVEKLGGEVGVESEGVPGEGSVFFFTLPAAGARVEKEEE